MTAPDWKFKIRYREPDEGTPEATVLVLIDGEHGHEVDQFVFVHPYGQFNGDDVEHEVLAQIYYNETGEDL